MKLIAYFSEQVGKASHVRYHQVADPSGSVTEIDAMDLVTQPLLADWIEVVREHRVAFVAAALSAVAVVWLLWYLLLRKRPVPRPSDELVVDVSYLPDLPPPSGPPILEFYNLRVRLVAVVLAPVGRAGELPSREELPEVIDSIVPGLDAVVAAHEPLVRAWPRQVSTRGFARTFFQNLRLPGERGKKGLWSAVAGIFRFGEEPMMAALVLRAEIPNRHGNYVMEREDAWLGILRVRLD